MDYWSQKCSICFDAPLDICLEYCHDQYCIECFERYITEVVMSSWGIGVTKVKCPVCQEHIPQSEWSQYVPELIVNHYDRFNQPFRSFTRCCPYCEKEAKPCDYTLRSDINYQQKIYEFVKSLAETCGYKGNNCNKGDDDLHARVHSSVYSLLKTVENDHWESAPLMDIYKRIIKILLQFEQYHTDHHLPIHTSFQPISTVSTPYPYTYYISHEFTLVSTLPDVWKQIQFLHISNFSNMTCQDCNTHFCLKCGYKAHENLSCEEMMQSIIDSADQTDDTKITVKWQLKNSQRCPNCSIMINRDEGCNKVDCLLCGFCFCWACKSPWSEKCGFYQCSLTNESINIISNFNEKAELGVPDMNTIVARIHNNNTHS
ncbi:hypothetical protein BJ944DRAFT_88434 [Cunninghamella echinulata]|nr:hypothetical protein BJ944DRAFT_88434 [Cunninghamella echinulata]